MHAPPRKLLRLPSPYRFRDILLDRCSPRCADKTQRAVVVFIEVEAAVAALQVRPEPTSNRIESRRVVHRCEVDGLVVGWRLVSNMTLWVCPGPDIAAATASCACTARFRGLWACACPLGAGERARYPWVELHRDSHVDDAYRWRPRAWRRERE